MKKISYLFNAICLGLALSFFVQYRNSQSNLDYFKFDYRPPKFSDRENQLIRKTFPVILEKLDTPANYYVSSVKEEENRIIISVLPLRALQMGVDSTTGKGVGMWDGGIKFIFDAEYRFLEKGVDA